MKTAVGSELSLVSGNYHEYKVSVVMEMASFSLKIRHVFGFTTLTERSVGAGPPVIIQLSGHNSCLTAVMSNIFANVERSSGSKCTAFRANFAGVSQSFGKPPQRIAGSEFEVVRGVEEQGRKKNR